MAGFKETPRQKMIGMMYLVLTALLALNVSKEILDAFVIVNDSIKQTSESFASKIDDLHTDFQAQYSLDKTKVGPHYNAAQKAATYSAELVRYLDSLKYSVIAETEGIPFDTAKIRDLSEINGKDNFDVPTRLLVGEEGYEKRGGWEAQRRIIAYRANMMALIHPNDTAHFSMGLNTEGSFYDADNVDIGWVRYNFYHTILAADVTIFNKLKNEVNNTEYDVVKYLFQNITKEDFKFSDITAKIIPKSVFVFQGEPFEAEVIIAAVDKTSSPVGRYKLGVTEWHDEFSLNAITIPGDSGSLSLTIETGNLSPQKYTFAGQIGIKKPNSSEIEYHDFSSSFYLAEPSANVSATKMNVFYRGVDNPINIAAAGVPKAELGHGISGDGAIVETPDGLVVRNLTKRMVQEVTVSVFSESGEERKKLGEQVFRVKDLPDPVVSITGADKGYVAKEGFLANPYVRCALPEYVNFDFKFKVVSFNMWVKKNGSDYQMMSNSGKLTPDMINYIRSARKNTMLVFTDINVRGPIRKRDVGSFVIKVN
ncbi:MAG: hypothetical protein B7C24_01550 [Bacteroidetes bacterium 4572_77]|nr:MAG: hypothetical protein B7C24_01550 [Bacteroidetes bacterium 4572_77]